jgi:hypothetical protein
VTLPSVRAGLLLGDLNATAQRIGHPHLFDRAAANVE